MVTAGDDVEAAVAAMKTGAYDYLRKPFSVDAVEMAVRRALDRRRLELENRAHRTELEALVHERTREVRRVARRLAETQAAIIWIACSLAESRDGQTGAHLDRMAAYCRVLALTLPASVRARHGTEEDFADRLAESAPLHDIGKVAIPDSILLKRGRLTGEEWDIMRRHPSLGCEILETVRRRLAPEGIPLLDLAVEICAAHHERYDGSGYPEGLAGEAIPLAARIAALADFYDATTSPRAYRPVAFPHEQVREMICRERGGAFDPVVVDAFLAAEPEFIAAGARLRDIGNVFRHLHPTPGVAAAAPAG
jgi:putative two-component system response regulator